MPEYSFVCDGCGEKQSRFASSDSPPQKAKCSCGKTARRDWQTDMGVLEDRRSVEGHIKSESLAVNPNEVEEEMASDRKIGSTCDYYDRDGVPHWKGDIGSATARCKKYMADRGYTNSGKY